MKWEKPRRWGVALGIGLGVWIVYPASAKAELVLEGEKKGEKKAKEEFRTFETEGENNPKIEQNRKPGITQRGELRQVLDVLGREEFGRKSRNNFSPTKTSIDMGRDRTPRSQPEAQSTDLQGPEFNQQNVIDQKEESGAAQYQSEEKEEINFSRSELLRRERLREELKNEDLLQERLEELRLRDEQKRTDSLFGTSGDPAATNQGEELNGSRGKDVPAASVPTKSEKISVPVTDETPLNSTLANPTAPVLTPGAQQEIQESSLKSSANGLSLSTASPAEEPLIFSIQPHGGIGGIQTDAVFSMKPRYSVGVSGVLQFSDHLALDAGYTFSEYGIGLGSTNPWVLQARSYANQFGYPDPQFDFQMMKQNVVDAGLRVYATKPESRIRPFIGGGLGWSKSFINYDPTILKILNQSQDAFVRSLATDYELSSYLGFLSTGIDIKLSKTVSLGTQFKYYRVLTSTENHPIAYGGFYGQGYSSPYYSPYGVYPGQSFPGYQQPGYVQQPVAADYDKQYASGSLRRVSFYLISLGLSISF